MNLSNESKVFDQCIEAYDWRYAASIVGLFKYLSYFGEKDVDFKVTDDAIEFSSDDITKERYLQFVEHYYDVELQHVKIEKILKGTEFSDDQIKMVNDLMQGNSILKKVFKKIKFDGENKNEILTLIADNRSDLILETYRNKKNMYANFANVNQLFNDRQERCRLLGYYVDGGRKSKSISYNFDTKTFVSQDENYFDFIPFAFIGNFESFFINDSYSVEELISTNIDFEHYVKMQKEELKDREVKVRTVLFESIHEISDFLNYDVEVIYKNRDAVFFETMYLRNESIDIIKNVRDYRIFSKPIKLGNDFIDIQKEVLNDILNLVRVDSLINMLLKENYRYLVSHLIALNTLICKGGEHMNQAMKNAYACAKKVVVKIPENKISSYRQKLISSIVIEDYDRYCQILLQMSNYCDIPFNFAFDLFEDFESNKDVAYTFINALTVNDFDKKEEAKDE